MTSPDPIVDVVRAIVERVAGPARTPARADAATPLAQGYWLDSMELLEIVLACEEHFGIAFEEASDLTPQSLATLGSLAATVRARMAAGASPP